MTGRPICHSRIYRLMANTAEYARDVTLNEKVRAKSQSSNLFVTKRCLTFLSISNDAP